MEPSDGGIDKISITFLLKDLSLRKTDVGIVVGMMMTVSYPIFFFGLCCGHPFLTQRFEGPNPWPRKKNTSIGSSTGSLPEESRTVLIGQSCRMDTTSGFKSVMAAIVQVIQLLVTNI